MTTMLGLIIKMISVVKCSGWNKPVVCFGTSSCRLRLLTLSSKVCTPVNKYTNIQTSIYSTTCDNRSNVETSRSGYHKISKTRRSVVNVHYCKYRYFSKNNKNLSKKQQLRVTKNKTLKYFNDSKNTQQQ